MGIVHAAITTFPSSAAAGLFEVSSGNALRLLQSVGILLPLFAGLLRFTTSDRSEVSERVNDHLLLGILGLVFAGASAVIGGMLTEKTGLLKLSLLFILSAFIVIGLAAGAMFGELTTGDGGNDHVTKENDTAIETEDPKSVVPEDTEEYVSAKAEAESVPEPSDEDEQTENANGMRNNYDDRD